MVDNERYSTHLLALPQNTLQKLQILYKPLRILARDANVQESDRTLRELEDEIHKQWEKWFDFEIMLKERAEELDVDTATKLPYEYSDSMTIFMKGLRGIHVKVTAAVDGMNQLEESIWKKQIELLKYEMGGQG
ncbi:MAG: hypothetical protein Q9166_007754 [cf. Caloplaca sp. 2 TL-2023]